MATYSKVKLSGSTDGRQIKVSSTTSGAANTIHTAGSGTSNMDEIWVYCVNSSATACKLTILWGGTSSPDDEVEIAIPAESGLFLIIPGLILQNSLIVKAFAAVTNVLLISGFVNRITA